MRFKEDVDLLAKKDFVCCFCLASKILFLLREVEALKNEVKELRERNLAEKAKYRPTRRMARQRVYLATRLPGYTRNRTARW